ncbi:MAG: trypsin-like peptidase domain-containing protein [Oscillospiraceae bacterium]|jgi:S1-C subfamily serine protease|nr:trypsin-like peptidase domain-containing protein [Oscillospiraceae bacterium]
MKKLISAILSVLLLFALAVPALADEPQQTRAQFVRTLYASLDADKLEQFNDIPDGSIRDIPRGAPYESAVYALYRAGILATDDKFNRFFPDRPVTASEVELINFRVRYPASRRINKIKSAFTAQEIFTLTTDAVFTIETFDKSGKTIRTGSAFFISADGTAATCLHVLDNAVTAEITLTSGEKHKVLGVSAYSVKTNVALLKIDSTDAPSGFPWLPVADSAATKVGQTAYSLGTPLELDGTISKGLVSYVNRKVDEREMTQFTSNISQGSGGGALLDAQGRVIGITSSSYSAGETLNLAEPSKHILALTPGSVTRLADIKR